MKTSVIVAFINDVIEKHRNLDVTIQIDTTNHTSPVIGFLTQVIPETGKRVLVICHKDTQVAPIQI